MKTVRLPSLTLVTTDLMPVLNTVVIDKQSGVTSGFIKGFSNAKDFLGELFDTDRITKAEYTQLLDAVRQEFKRYS